MSKCTDCKIELDTSNAYRKQKRLMSRCKECFNKYCSKRWIKRKEEAVLAKGNECFDCKKSFPYVAYDFHHLDPSRKDMTWKDMRQTTEVLLQAELSKCVLLCAVCHRIRHYNERLSN